MGKNLNNWQIADKEDHNKPNKEEEPVLMNSIC